jgi:hypothetical protein
VNVFAKIFAQIFDSSISTDFMVRHVFMDLLVLADRDGVVDMTLDAISRRTNVPEEIVSNAIAELMKEDRKSRSHEEHGKRLVPLDSHRDWGWQIVNYEHYRAIRDEESRKTYFRDYKRQYRQAKASTKSPHLSTPVLDSPTMSTEAEGEVDTEVKKKPTRAKPLQAAVLLMEMLGLAAGNYDLNIVAQVIEFEAREAHTNLEETARFLTVMARDAIARGEVVNTFWFKDRKFAQEENRGKNHASRGGKRISPAKERVDGNRRAIADALAARGVDGPWNTPRADSEAIPEPRPIRVVTGIPD